MPLPASAQDDALFLATREVLELARTASSEQEYTQLALDRLRQLGRGEWWLVQRVVDRWQVWQGPSKSPPPLSSLAEWLAEAMDQEQTLTNGIWQVVPRPQQEPACCLLYRRGSDERSAVPPIPFNCLAAALWNGLLVVPSGATTEGPRLVRLEAILTILQHWSEHRDTAQMLHELAEAATKLLGAERASIFLWDRPRHQLVARPALGVAGGELRIPDDRGVVGMVVKTGEVRRVDAEDTRDINRDVDTQLGFVTRNLMCVPIHTSQRKCLGAFELINKRSGNFTAEDATALVELAQHAAVALATAQDRDQLFESRRHMAEQAAEKVKLIGNSPSMEALRNTIQRVAETDLALLILGENGTGKEVVSQMVHYLSRRRNDPFVAVNCAALTETLLESEIFGHEKGAFTDAHESRAGKFELAARGTLFLDEIGDLSLSGQAKLLRVLEEKVVVRVGGSVPIPTDARVIAATNHDLGKLVRQGKFREDLFFRLNVVPLRIPPLRDRPEDIPSLADYFLRTFSVQARRTPPRFTEGALRRLSQHSWPGNVRELRNLMERLAYLTTSDSIEPADLDFVASPSGASPAGIALNWGLSEATRQFQVEYIQRHIQAAQGNLSLAAERLGVHRSNLYRKMKQLGMEEGENSAEEGSQTAGNQLPPRDESGDVHP